MLTRLIAHLITKRAHQTTANLQLRDRVLPANSTIAVDLFDQLRASFTSGNPVAGAFLTTSGTVPRFQQILSRYLGADTDAAFVTFSREAMGVLRDEMTGQQAATGGYVVFAEFEADGTKFLFAALLGTTAKPNFDDNLNLIQSPTLDLDHLRHGARIRYDKITGNQDGVVLFISKEAKGASDYFVNFIGCEEIARPEVQGRFLYTALQKWAEGQQYNDDQKSQLLQGVYSYWQDCRKNNQAMTLTGISNALSPNDPNALLTHLGAEAQGLAGEFPPPPPNVMKRFIKFAINKGGLKLEFDRSLWENNVRINVSAKTLTITNLTEELVVAIKRELENVS